MTSHARPWLALGLAGLALFTLVTLLVLTDGLAAADRAAGEALRGASGLVLASSALAFVGGASFVIPVLLAASVALVLFRRTWGAARVLLIPAAADTTARLLKLVFMRPRPDAPLAEAVGYSFPSGHAALGASLAVLAAWFATRHLKPRALVIALLALGVAGALAVSASRVVLGVHHLTDVLAGMALGAGVAGLLLAASVRLERRLRQRWT